jgi:hypothetical protein
MPSAGAINQRVAFGGTTGENTSIWASSITALHSASINPMVNPEALEPRLPRKAR